MNRPRMCMARILAIEDDLPLRTLPVDTLPVDALRSLGHEAGRVLFLAHRVAATGVMRVEIDGRQSMVGVRSGRVVHLSGVPGLFSRLGAPLVRPPDSQPSVDVDQDSTAASQGDLGGNLAQGLRAAVAAGHSPDGALVAAAEALGAWLAGLVDKPGGTVTFDSAWAPPAGSFPLPDAIPRLLASGLALMRSDALVARTWARHDAARLSPCLIDDPAESRWGIDAASMRVLRLAPRAQTVAMLIRDAAGEDKARRTEVLRAIDTLTVLGLLRLDAAPRSAAAGPWGGPPAPKLDAPPQEDPRARTLADDAAMMERGHPLEVLQLTSRTTLSEHDVATAYREISRRYHPDTFFKAPPAVRALAEACFAHVNGAYAALQTPEGLADARQHLEAIVNGVTFVGKKDRGAARLAFRKAEVAFRARNWKAADPLFQEAARLDAQTWPHSVLAAVCGWLAGRIPAFEALGALEALRPPEPEREAEVLVYMGNVLKQEGREAEALARYRAAARLHPDNRDAQRELWLEEKRRTGTDPRDRDKKR